MPFAFHHIQGALVKIVALPYDREPVPRRQLDLLHPEAYGAPYALCFVHGGGWRAGAPDSWHEQMRHAAGRGVISASLGYRVGGRLEELMSDVSDGYRLFVDHLASQGLGGLPVFLIGSSAGAHLATLLTLLDVRGWRTPAGCVALNGPGTMRPWPDMDPQIASAVEHLTTAASPENYVQPGAPPFLFVTVGKERYFPHEHVHALADRLRAAHNQATVMLLPKAEHGFFYHPESEDSKAAQAAIDDFISERLLERTYDI